MSALVPFSWDVWASPEEAQVSSAGLLRFLDAWEAVRGKIQFHSLIVLRHGKIVSRMNFAPYDEKTPHVLYSLSKSFTSAAAGFAVSEGKLDWDSSVVDILPEEIPQGREAELRPITLRALLCMGSGLAPESDSPSADPAVTWARHVLSHPVLYPPMTHFHYNSFGTYLVSCMVQKVTGQTIRDYLVPRLFAPLGIETPDWDLSPQGICCGGFGLHLASDSIARFGQCLLQKGVWQGKQVLPAGWVDLATREHIANYEGQRQDGNEWGQGYGFQFWRCMDGRYRGDGMYGQFCMVDVKRDMVVAATCGCNDMGLEFQLVREHLFPAADAPAGTAADQQWLQKRIAALSYAFPTDDGTAVPLPEGVFETDSRGSFRIQWKTGVLNHIELRLNAGTPRQITFHLSREQAGLAAVTCWNGVENDYYGAYGWDHGKLRVALHCLGAPDTLDGVFSWQGNELIFDGLGVAFPSDHAVFTRVPDTQS